MPIAQRFADYLSRDGITYQVVPAHDPPDFFLEPGSWLELSDIYLNNDQARFLNSPRVKWTPYFGPVGKLDFSGLAGYEKPAEP